MIRRGDVWWAELAELRGSEPGYRRPVVVLQSDAFNRSGIATVVVAAISSNLELAAAPGNVRLSRRESGLPRESVVNVSQVLTLDRRFLVESAGRLPASVLREVESGLRLVLSLLLPHVTRSPTSDSGRGDHGACVVGRRASRRSRPADEGGSSRSLTIRPLPSAALSPPASRSPTLNLEPLISG